MDDFSVTGQQRSFLLSNIPSKTERDNLVKKILDLGGCHVDSKSYEESVSHVIFGKLSRNEKFLGACVTGKWMLSPLYIEHSHQVQMWLEEEDYEFSVSDKNQPEGLVSAAKRWKWRNKMFGSVPFADWRVSLYMNNSMKKACFQRILECGGAKTIPFQADGRTEHNAAFVLVDSQEYSNVTSLQEDSDLLYIREDYLGDYIIKDPEPDLFDYLIGKSGIKQNVITIIESPYYQRPKATDKSVKSSVASPQRDEVIDELVVSSSNNNLIHNDLVVSHSTNNHICTKGTKDLDKGNKDNSLKIPQRKDPVIDLLKDSNKRSKKGKRPLAVRPLETTDYQQLEGRNSSDADVSKCKKLKLNADNHTQFSPKALRSSLNKKENSSKIKSQTIKIYEDKLSMKKDSNQSDEQMAIQSESLPHKVQTGEEIHHNKEQGSAISNLLTEEVIAASLIPSPSKSKLYNIPVIKEISMSLTTSVDSHSSGSSSLQDPTVVHCISANNVHIPNSCESSENSSLERPTENKCTKSSQQTPKKAIQKSLQDFGFHLITPKKDDQKAKPSVSPKCQSSSTSNIKTPVIIKREPISPLKEGQNVNITNTPDKAIVIDSDSENYEIGSFTLTELLAMTSDPQISIKGEQQSQKEGCDSGHLSQASDKVKTHTDDDEESYDDLMREVMMLCMEGHDSTMAAINVQRSEKCEGITPDNMRTYQEVYCDDVLQINKQADCPKSDKSLNSNQISSDSLSKDLGNQSAMKESDRSSDLGKEMEVQKSCKAPVCCPDKSIKALMGRNDGRGRCNAEICHKEDSHLCNKRIPTPSCYLPQPLDASSYSHHLASEVSLPLNLFCINSGEKAFISPLISQWMQASTEMNFYSISLEHGYPSSNQKPTPEVLSEVIKLVTCDDSRIRNLAFNYLMSWFEYNPPTCPVSIRLYSDVFCLTAVQTVLTDNIDTLISSPDSNGHSLLLDFAVAVMEVNYWHLLNLGNKYSVKECLLIKWLWRQSSGKIHFNSQVGKVLEAFQSVLSGKSKNHQTINSMKTLLGLISECFRLAGNYWNLNHFSNVTDCMISFSRETARKIRDAFGNGDEQSVILTLQGLKPAWLQTLVTAYVLSSLNDFLVMETIQVSNISLASIVTQYFFLLPSLTRKPVPNSLQNCMVRLEKTNISTADVKMSVRNRNSGSAKVNKKNSKGETLVHRACIKNDIESLKRLLSIPDVDVNAKDNSEWTPLHEACNHGSYDCVELLLNYVPPVNSVFGDRDEMKKRVDINAKGFMGKTPLLDAVANNHIDICNLLLRYGGQKLLYSKTFDGYTPLNLARTEEMRKTLLMHYSANNQSAALETVPGSSDTLKAFDNSLPLSSMYDKVLRTDGNHFCAETKDCSWFLSLLNLLMSSYMKYALLKGRNSLTEKDIAVLNNMDFHTNLLQEHLMNITSPETFETLDFQIRMLKTVVCTCSL